MPRRTDAYRGLAQASRLQVLSAIFRTPGIGLAELSAMTGLHENTVRDHVHVLESEGFIRSDIQHRGTRGRPRSVFSPVRAEDENDIEEERIRKAKQHGDLLRRLVPIGATALDEEALHQLDVLYQHFDDLGLDPEIDEQKLAVTLVPCQFHALAEGNRDAMCHVHEQLIRTILVRADGPVELDHVAPFTTPHTCRVRLALHQEPSARTAHE